MFKLNDAVLLLAIEFPSKEPAVAVLTGEEKFKFSTEVHPVSEVGFNSEISVGLVL